MKHYSSIKRGDLSLKKLVFSLIAFLGVLVTHVHAQSTANYAFTTNTSGSLGLDANANVVDMTTGTTQLIGADLDDNTSSQTGIGFNFTLMGVTYTQFYATSNGLIQLGTSAPSTTLYSLGGGSTASPRIGALTADLRTGTAGKVHYKLIGTAPNRCLVVEFSNMSLTYVASPGSNDGTYQVRLYETTGAVEFVYGSMFRNASTTSSATIYSGFSVGSAANTQASITTAANTVSTGATFDANSYTTSANIPNLHSTTEGARRVYRFTPPAIPAAATALTFSGVGATVMTLNWVDNASTESGYYIYRSLDGVSYTLVSTAAANATTYSATGLSLSTLYYWKVVPFSEAGLATPDLINSQSTTGALMAGGTKTVGAGGDYQNLTTAFADINAQGLLGNVDLQMIAGYPAAPETYPILSCNNAATGAFAVKVYPMVSGLTITSANTTGTLNLNGATNVTFDGRVNQAGANDLVIANTNAGASYAVQFVNDAKSNTLKYCTIQSANTSTTSGTIIFAGSTGTTGNDNNTIDHCDVKDGATVPTNAIYSAGTSTTIDNSGNTVSNSNIFNYFNAASASNGIFVASNSSAWTIDANRFYQAATRTLTSGNTHRAINIVTSSGNGYVVTNNVIGYAAAAGTGVTTYTASSGRFVGIEITTANTGTTSSIQGNTVTAISLTTTSGTTAAPGIFTGISVLGGNAAIGNVTPNTIGAATGTGSINVTTSNSANVFGIHANSTGTLNIANNVIGSVTAAGSAAGISCGMTGINTTGAATATSITGNTIGGATANSIALNTSGVTTTTATFSGIATAGNVTTLTVSNNTISNVVNYATSTSASNGIAVAGSPTTAVITNNTISNLALSLGLMTGISAATPTTTTISGNTFAASSVTSATGTGNINGISNGGTTSSIFKNKIYNLNVASANSLVNGILIASGTTANVYNNVIGDLKSPIASGADVIRGIAVTSTTASTTYRIYYNSIYLNATSTGTNFGTSGIFHTVSATATTAALDMRNNIIINESAPAGTGITVAFRRSGTALNNFASTSNRNMLYAGTPLATRLIMYDGTTSYQTMLSYQTAVVPRDANSFTGEAFVYATPGSFFISLTPSSTDYLKPVAGITTQAESGGVNITTPLITDDFTGAIRAGNAGYVGTGTSPDLGAFEFAGVTPTPIVTLNSVTPPTTAQCVVAARLVSVNVNPSSGTTAAVNLAYTVNGVPQTAISMTNTTGSTWTATIPAPTPANATITWGVAATNSIGLTGSYTGTPYADEPLTGSTATVAASPAGPLCAGASTTLSAVLSKAVTAQIGTATTTTALTAQPTAFCNRWSSYRMQTVYTAAELTAAGLTAGPITSMTFNIISLGSAATNAAFTVKVGTTGLTAFTDFIPTTGFVTVFPAATYTHAVGLNTINFSTPYNWDGVSNIVVEVSHNGANSSNNAETYYTATPGNTVAWSTNGSATGTPSQNRLNVTFAGNGAPTVQSISWSDGATTVGTGTPLSVTPTATTTYTATITAAGCAVTPAPTVTVTVNPLPSAPTATNSAQCGTQVPTASVTSTTGVPTPTFNWYDAAVAGTLAQPSGTAATFTSNVAATTTFYVSELNVTTGCLSPRTPVTITVATADGVSAAAAPTSFCIGSTVTLTAANTNPTPNQSYSYSWSGPAGSGAETPVTGASVTITPTVAGTYTYNLAAVDGGCNAVATTSATVNPFTATLAPVDATCNGVANGSFTQGASTCGTMPYTYSVDGGAFGAIPTNLAAGAHAVIVKDANNFQTSTITVTIGQPTTTITNPAATNASVCQNSANALVSATATVSTPTPGSIVVPFNVTGQPTETNAAPGNIVASATYTLPAGATVTGGTLVYNGLVAMSPSWMSDIRLGFSGAVVNNAAAGTGSTDAAGTLNYTRAIPAAAISAAGGAVNLLYWDFFNDNAGAEATFPTGATAATLTINYTTPSPATISWWDASTGGTQIGTGSPFETVGTSVLPNTNTPGVYTVYAQGQNGACPSPGRTAVTVTVKAKSTASMTQTACNSYTLNGTTYNTSGTYTQTLTNAAGCDSTLTLNLTIKLSTSSSMTQTACSSYTLNGTTYNTSGVYTQTLTNAVGCDSTLTLNLTINQPTTASMTQTACSSYTLNGQTYTASGTYTQTLTNALGCDSTLTLNLTITQPSSSSMTQTACSSYTLNGQTYTASGVYTQMLTNAAGCDSTLTLNLTINQPTTATVNGTGCNAYTYNGTTYNTSGTYTQTLTNAAGCDSVVTINVVLNNSFGTITDTACSSYSFNGTTYTVSGSYMDTLVNMAGCDSIVTLNLTINQPTTSAMTQTACNSYTLNGTTYNTSGTYTQALTNAAGCDSTLTLTLTIIQPTSSSMTVTECGSYTLNGTTYNASGTYTQTLTNAAGCDSTLTLILTIDALPNAVATDNGDLTITASAGTSYQWVHCATGLPIAGATAQTFTATVNGSYAVVVTNAAGCSDTSNCVTVSTIGIDELSDAGIRVFPNPTHNDVTVVMSAAAATIDIVDAKGQLLATVKVANGEKVDLSAYETGIYFLRIRTDNGSAMERIVKN